MASSPRNEAGELYRKIYAELGFELGKDDGISEVDLASAEDKIKTAIPPSLRDYYLVAGKEKKVNTAFNRLVPPEDWEVHSGKVVFMVENQSAVVWGASIEDKQGADPNVFQCAPLKGELKQWFDEKSTCSQFLVFMLHCQCAYGGAMPHCFSATVPARTVSLLDKDWSFGGEVTECGRIASRDNRFALGSGKSFSPRRWSGEFLQAHRNRILSAQYRKS